MKTGLVKTDVTTKSRFLLHLIAVWFLPFRPHLSNSTAPTPTAYCFTRTCNAEGNQRKYDGKWYKKKYRPVNAKSPREKLCSCSSTTWPVESAKPLLDWARSESSFHCGISNDKKQIYSVRTHPIWIKTAEPHCLMEILFGWMTKAMISIFIIILQEEQIIL